MRSNQGSEMRRSRGLTTNVVPSLRIDPLAFFSSPSSTSATAAAHGSPPAHEVPSDQQRAAVLSTSQCLPCFYPHSHNVSLLSIFRFAHFVDIRAVVSVRQAVEGYRYTERFLLATKKEILICCPKSGDIVRYIAYDDIVRIEWAEPHKIAAFVCVDNSFDLVVTCNARFEQRPDGLLHVGGGGGGATEEECDKEDVTRVWGGGSRSPRGTNVSQKLSPRHQPLSPRSSCGSFAVRREDVQSPTPAAATPLTEPTQTNAKEGGIGKALQKVATLFKSSNSSTRDRSATIVQNGGTPTGGAPQHNPEASSPSVFEQGIDVVGPSNDVFQALAECPPPRVLWDFVRWCTLFTKSGEMNGVLKSPAPKLLPMKTSNNPSSYPWHNYRIKRPDDFTLELPTFSSNFECLSVTPLEQGAAIAQRKERWEQLLHGDSGIHPVRSGGEDSTTSPPPPRPSDTLSVDAASGDEDDNSNVASLGEGGANDDPELAVSEDLLLVPRRERSHEGLEPTITLTRENLEAMDTPEGIGTRKRSKTTFQQRPDYDGKTQNSQRDESVRAGGARDNHSSRSSSSEALDGNNSFVLVDVTEVQQLEAERRRHTMKHIGIQKLEKPPEYITDPQERESWWLRQHKAVCRENRDLKDEVAALKKQLECAKNSQQQRYHHHNHQQRLLF